MHTKEIWFLFLPHGVDSPALDDTQVTSDSSAVGPVTKHCRRRYSTGDDRQRFDRQEYRYNKLLQHW